MGAGKTTVGRALAKELKFRFIDSDHEIENRTGVPIPTIFEIEGETGFRQREKQLIEELTAEEGVLLATGGGVILDADNRRCLHERTRHDRNRPLLQVDDRLGVLQNLHKLRDPLYRETAHLVVEINHGSAAQVVRRIVSQLSDDA